MESQVLVLAILRRFVFVRDCVEVSFEMHVSLVSGNLGHRKYERGAMSSSEDVASLA